MIIGQIGSIKGMCWLNMVPLRVRFSGYSPRFTHSNNASNAWNAIYIPVFKIYNCMENYRITNLYMFITMGKTDKRLICL